MISKRNGDRARFQKERKRKMLRRQRLQELIKVLRGRPALTVGRDVQADCDDEAGFGLGDVPRVDPLRLHRGGAISSG
jgi:hypothetical protein